MVANPRQRKTMRSLPWTWAFWTVPAATLLLCQVEVTSSQQAGDPEFLPSIHRPAFPDGSGPVVLVDEAHNNYHTVGGRYRAFAELLRQDGYVVMGMASPFTSEELVGADILVIANALAAENVKRWTLPTPSAFEPGEIAAVEEWVRDGGSLLLIADHMPFPGAAGALAARFGIVMGNGYAHDTRGDGTMRFRTADGTLTAHPITGGRDPAEAVTLVVSFTGQAFRAEPGTALRPLMILPADTALLLPSRAGKISKRTPRENAGGLLQGATVRVEAGRVAVFGEASMFTAQVAGPRRWPQGMNHPEAFQNAQFLLNVLHWLSGLLPDV